MTRQALNSVYLFTISITILLFSNLAIASSNTQEIPNPINEAESGSMIFQFDDHSSAFQTALKTRVEMNIIGSINRVSVIQTFINSSDKWVEGIYVFPLPEDSAVDQLKMYVNDRVIEGQIHEKEEAKKIYESAKSDGKVASLIEQQRPNIFTTNVANIQPGGVITVAIEYQQAVHIENDTYSIRFPMVVGDRYIPGKPIETLLNAMGVSKNTDLVPDASKITPISENHIRHLTGEDFETNLPVIIDVNLSAGFSVDTINSTYHKIKTKHENQTTQSISLDGPYQADRDFELTWSAIKKSEPEVALFAQERGGDVYLMLMAIPPKDDVFKVNTRPREVIFIVDSSGSMSGSSIHQATDSLKKALDSLEPTDRFNIVDFDGGYQTLFKGAKLATPRMKSTALTFIERIQADGGTEMLAPIAYALNSRDAESRHYLRQIVFITDGQSGDEASLFAKVKSEINNDRFFTIGIGSAPNSYLLTKLADFGRGAYTYIGSQNEVSQKMNSLFEKLESPALTDIKVNFPPEIVSELAQDVIYDLYVGETITAAFKMNALPDSLIITGKTIDGDYIKELDINSLSNTKGIDILWARQKLERLTDVHDNAYTTRTKDLSKIDILALALEYHLVSRFTSLVAIDITPSRPEHEDLVTQAIIKKAKADGLEDEIQLDKNGNLQNRDQLMLALMNALPVQYKSDSAEEKFERVLRSAQVPVNASLAMRVPDELAFVETPVYMINPSQTATYSELLMYIGLALMLIVLILRRRLGA
jgi:Ca-activated chloride channel homolog